MERTSKATSAQLLPSSPHVVSSVILSPFSWEGEEVDVMTWLDHVALLSLAAPAAPEYGPATPFMLSHNSLGLGPQRIVLLLRNPHVPGNTVAH